MAVFSTHALECRLLRNSGHMAIELVHFMTLSTLREHINTREHLSRLKKRRTPLSVVSICDGYWTKLSTLPFLMGSCSCSCSTIRRPKRPAWENDTSSFIKDLEKYCMHRAQGCLPSFHDLVANGITSVTVPRRGIRC